MCLWSSRLSLSIAQCGDNRSKRDIRCVFPLQSYTGCDTFSYMSTLAEIEKATDALSATEKQQLLLYVAALLKAQGTPLPDTLFSRDQRVDWMAEDEAAMRRFHPNS
jgi:hypothetical protein